MIREGSIGGGLFIVLAGEIALYEDYQQPHQHLLTIVKPGYFFGENTLFLGDNREATAVAITQSVVLEITYANIFEFFNKHPEAVFSIIQELCIRLHPPVNTTVFNRPSMSALTPAAPILPVVKSEAKPSAPKVSVPAAKATPSQPTSTPKAVLKPPAAAPQAAPPAPTPDAPCQSTPPAGRLLLPEGHGDYTLPLDNNNKDYLFERDFSCPMCGKKFKTLAVKSFKLVTASTDPDMRVRYRGIEPMFYNIITCPDCLYSATEENFPTGTKTKLFLANPLSEMKPYLAFKQGYERDTQTVFLSYYLALTCAPLCFPRHQLITAALWMRLSRIYTDCKDDAMQKMATQSAFDAYMNAYEKLDITPMQAPQLNNMIAEMAYQLGDYKTARKFFFKLKTDKSAPRVLKDHADDRVNVMREIDGIERPE